MVSLTSFSGIECAYLIYTVRGVVLRKLGTCGEYNFFLLGWSERDESFQNFLLFIGGLPDY